MNMQNDDWKCEHLIRAPRREKAEAHPLSLEKRREATEQRLASVRALAAKGMSPGEITLATGINASTVYDICRRHNIVLVDRRYTKKGASCS
jgi:hypothetical protein